MNEVRVERYIARTALYAAVIGANKHLESLETQNGQRLVGSAGAGTFGGEPFFSISHATRLEVDFRRDGELTSRHVYQFASSSVQIHAERYPSQWNGLHVDFSEAAQSVEFLQYNDVRPLPMKGDATDIQELRLIYADGTRLDFASTGPWSNFNPSTNGSVRQYIFERGALDANRR